MTLSDIAKQLPPASILRFAVDGKRNYVFAGGCCYVEITGTSYLATSKRRNIKKLIATDHQNNTINKLKAWADKHAETGKHVKEEDTEETTTPQ